MALTDLEPGTRVTDAHLGMGRSRQSKITRDIVQSNRALIGRVVKNKITSAQPISTNDLYPPGQGIPLALEPGMVAVTVPLSAPMAAKTGQFVNVHFLPMNDPEMLQNGGRIMTLFKGVKVLELTSVVGGARNAVNVTLELTPEQSNIMLLAKDKGQITMVYTPEGRGTGGVAVSDQDRATLYEILGYVPKPTVKPTPPFMTELFPGKDRNVLQFRDGVRTDNYRNYDPMDGTTSRPAVKPPTGRFDRAIDFNGNGGQPAEGSGGGPAPSASTGVNELAQ
jgi:pilus assembly protein CpaB